MILRYMKRRDWAWAAVCVIFIIIQVYLDLRIPEYMSEITDHLQMGLSTDIVSRDGIAMILCALLSLCASICAGVVAARIAASLSRTLRELQFDRVQSLSKQDIDHFSAASLITRSTNDVYSIQQFVARGLQIVVKAPIMAAWAVLKINSSAFEWTAATIVAMIVLVVSIAVLMKKSFPYFRRIQWLMDGVNRSTRENLNGLRVIRAYNAEPHQQEKFYKASEELLDNNVAAVHIMAPLQPISASMMNFLTLAIYWIGAGLIMSTTSQMTQMILFSDMIVFSSYATQVISSIMMMSMILRGLPRAVVSASRIEEVIRYEPSIVDGKGVEKQQKKTGEIEFINVSFSYPNNDTQVLSDISFKIEPGQTFAIVGPTGSGKSSLVKLIPRMYDTSNGSVLVDGADVKEYKLNDLHSKMGYVPQRAVIFSGPIRDNINYGENSELKSDKDMARAVETAQASDFINGLESGIDSYISQHGRNVSGGQKQRVCIARAICRDPEIYIFDDTFSALDYKTDRDLRDALKRETHDATTIIVAQRIGTVIDADRIIVMDNGRIVGDGNHATLIETCPLYKEMFESQMTEGCG